MHYAILGCIHGNAPALRACLEDIRARGIERIVCLGDVVGWGPDPLECIDLVRKSCFISIKGDHDTAILEENTGFIEKTQRVLDWTREQLDDGSDAQRQEKRRAFLSDALETFSSAGIAFVHGSPRSPFEYLFPSDVQRDPRKLRAAFAATEKVTFFCHTHVPGVINEDPLRWQGAQELSGYFHYKKGRKALINAGSVGQPRDGDPRACYLEIKKNEMFWRRVEYDLNSVIERLNANEAFTSDLAIRLSKGR